MGKVVYVCGNCSGTRVFEGDRGFTEKTGKGGRKKDLQCPFCITKEQMRLIDGESNEKGISSGK